MARQTWKPGTLVYPVPAALVTCKYGDKENILTVAWTGTICSDPAMTYISIRKERYSYDLIKKSGVFCINLTTEELDTKIQAFECDFTYDNHNRQRMVRLLNKLESGWMPDNSEYKLIYDDVIFIGLTIDRDVLYERINKRFDGMIVPLIDEVKPYAMNNIKSKSLMTGIGYKEFYPFFNNEATLASVVEECKKNSRNYAKRQYTWFNNQLPVTWFDVKDYSVAVDGIISYIDSLNSK